MAYRETRISHSEILLMPSNGESLQGYADRLKEMIQQHRHTVMIIHEKWWTHRSPSPCYICTQVDALEIVIDTLVQIQKLDKKALWQYKIDPNNRDVINLHRVRR